MTAEDRSGPRESRAVSPAKDGTPVRARRVITSEELLAGGREVDIRHADEVYTLRQTSKGKLILTK